MSLSNPPQDPRPGTPWIPGAVGQQSAGPGVAGGPAEPTAITETRWAADVPARAAGAGGLGRASPAGSGQAAGPLPGDVLEGLSQRLAIAGLRLAILRRTTASAEERAMLIQVGGDLDQAISEVRWLALAVRSDGQSGQPGET